MNFIHLPCIPWNPNHGAAGAQTISTIDSLVPLKQPDWGSNKCKLNSEIDNMRVKGLDKVSGKKKMEHYQTPSRFEREQC